MENKILLQDLSNALAEKTDISKKDADNFTRLFFDTIYKCVLQEKQVKVKGLGSFKLVEVQDRESVNVNTGERILIPGHSKVAFTPDTSLRDRINKPFADFQIVVINDSTPLEEMARLPQAEDDDEEDEVSGVQQELAANQHSVQPETTIVPQPQYEEPVHPVQPDTTIVPQPQYEESVEPVQPETTIVPQPQYEEPVEPVQPDTTIVPQPQYEEPVEPVQPETTIVQQPQYEEPVEPVQPDTTIVPQPQYGEPVEPVQPEIPEPLSAVQPQESEPIDVIEPQWSKQADSIPQEPLKDTQSQQYEGRTFMEQPVSPMYDEMETNAPTNDEDDTPPLPDMMHIISADTPSDSNFVFDENFVPAPMPEDSFNLNDDEYDAEKQRAAAPQLQPEPLFAPQPKKEESVEIEEEPVAPAPTNLPVEESVPAETQEISEDVTPVEPVANQSTDDEQLERSFYSDPTEPEVDEEPINTPAADEPQEELAEPKHEKVFPPHKYDVEDDDPFGNNDAERKGIQKWIYILLAILFVLLAYAGGYYTAKLSSPTAETPIETEQVVQPERTVAQPQPVEEVQEVEEVEETEEEEDAAPVASDEYAQLPDGDYLIVGTKGIHTMRVGDMLTKIALKEYGDKSFARYIIVHNNFENPDVIPLGYDVLLPELVKKQ